MNHNNHSLTSSQCPVRLTRMALQILIVMKYPDYTTQEHTASVGRDDVFSYFLNSDDKFPSETWFGLQGINQPDKF